MPLMGQRSDSRMQRAMNDGGKMNGFHSSAKGSKEHVSSNFMNL